MMRKQEAYGGGEVFVAGIDIGSNAVKALVINEQGNIISFRIAPTGALGMIQSRKVLESALSAADLKWHALSNICATGYGREQANYARLRISEITCHAKAAQFLIPGARTVIDIGGQDAKVIALNENGKVRNFVMNDKCAAGTGRFFEVIAGALELSISELGQSPRRSNRNLLVSSQCTVFAESEVISLLAQGNDIEDIVTAINEAIASRVAQLVRRLGALQPIVLQGGVAKNEGFIMALESILGCQLLIPDEPQIQGAMGAALLALNGNALRKAI